MAVTKSLLIPSKQEKWQVIYLDARPPFYMNRSRKWQVLLGPDSAFSSSDQVLKVAAELDQVDFNSIRFAAYLYQPSSATISNAGTCTFKVYKVKTPQWTEELVHTFSGVLMETAYFFADIPMSAMTSIDFSGGDTIMVEATVTRLTETYRERIYVNHLGIYDSLIAVRQFAEFLDLTKLDE